MTEFKLLANDVYTIEDVKRAFNKETRHSLMTFAAWGTSGVDAIDWIIDCDLIVANANLTKKQAEILRSTWHESMTYKEVAETHGVSINAIHLMVGRAIEKIEYALKKQRGWTYD